MTYSKRNPNWSGLRNAFQASWYIAFGEAYTADRPLVVKGDSTITLFVKHRLLEDDYAKVEKALSKNPLVCNRFIPRDTYLKSQAEMGKAPNKRSRLNCFHFLPITPENYEDTRNTDGVNNENVILKEFSYSYLVLGSTVTVDINGRHMKKLELLLLDKQSGSVIYHWYGMYRIVKGLPLADLDTLVKSIRWIPFSLEYISMEALPGSQILSEVGAETLLYFYTGRRTKVSPDFTSATLLVENT